MKNCFKKLQRDFCTLALSIPGCFSVQLKTKWLVHDANTMGGYIPSLGMAEDFQTSILKGRTKSAEHTRDETWLSYKISHWSAIQCWTLNFKKTVLGPPVLLDGWSVSDGKVRKLLARCRSFTMCILAKGSADKKNRDVCLNVFVFNEEQVFKTCWSCLLL